MLHLVQKCICKGLFLGLQFQSFFQSLPGCDFVRQSAAGVRVESEFLQSPLFSLLPATIQSLMPLRYFSCGETGASPVCV